MYDCNIISVSSTQISLNIVAHMYMMIIICSSQQGPTNGGHKCKCVDFEVALY